MTYLGYEFTAKQMQKFWSYVVRCPETGCWLWTGSRMVDKGYGMYWIVRGTSRKKFASHRLAYAMRCGGIPLGLEVDHLCRVHLCVNPGHLEVVTHQENIRRGNWPSARNARKTMCPRGHAYDYFHRSGRHCRTCMRVQWERKDALRRMRRYARRIEGAHA